ncbi:MAG: hypothetical protein J6M53_09950 [Bacteroidaceae bacterium]|nr:hypothetical protein [Bacteroidaceae bacterium]
MTTNRTGTLLRHFVAVFAFTVALLAKAGNSTTVTIDFTSTPWGTTDGFWKDLGQQFTLEGITFQAPSSAYNLQYFVQSLDGVFSPVVDFDKIPANKGSDNFTVTAPGYITFVDIELGHVRMGKQISKSQSFDGSSRTVTFESLPIFNYAYNKNYCIERITVVYNERKETLALAQTDYRVRLGTVSTMASPAIVQADYTGAPVYSSSDPDVAEVDAATGLVTFRGKGHATITVSCPEAGDYAAKDLSYSLFVWSLDEDSDGFNLIASPLDWEGFCLLTQTAPSASARLAADVDISPLAVSVGTSAVPFSGTFDGAGHTLTIGSGTGDGFYAPFRYVSGARFTDLTTAGTLTVRAQRAGGLISETTASSGQPTVIERCFSRVTLSMILSGDATAGGFVGLAGGDVAFTDCAVLGAMSRVGYYAPTNCGGFVGWRSDGASVTLTRVLNACTLNLGSTVGSATFSRNGTTSLTAAYYVEDMGDAQGTKLARSAIASGEAAYALQQTPGTAMWGQTIGTDAAPVLTTDMGKLVYKVDFVLDGGDVVYTAYRNTGVYGPLPADTDMGTVGAQFFYNDAMGDPQPFTSETSVFGDLTVSVTQSEVELQTDDDGFYLLGTEREWNWFALQITPARPDANARLTADIDLTSSPHMVGSNAVPYSGTFDGGGHKLVLNYNTSVQATAPFSVVSGATIRNLHTAGTVRSSEQFCTGLVGRSLSGGVTIAGCRSEATVYPARSGDATAGGFIGVAEGNVSITDCLFDGRMDGFSTTTSSGGFVGWAAGSVNIARGLMLPAEWHQQFYNESASFARNGSNLTLTEGYYQAYYDASLYTFQYEQGTRLDDTSVLASGAMAHSLQGDRADTYWGQRLGTDDKPHPTTDAAQRVYKVTFDKYGVTVATTYRNPGAFGAFSLAQFGYSTGDVLVFDDAGGNTVEFTAETVIAGDLSVRLGAQDYELARDADGTYVLASMTDWIFFATQIVPIVPAANARMACDINLFGTNTMVGSASVPYSGTFDGAGHTLNLSIDTNVEATAPFSYVSGATILNLHTTGSVRSKAQFCTGLVGRSQSGGVTIRGCRSEVHIWPDRSGDATAGGFIGVADGQVVISDCLFDGTMYGGTSTTCSGGFAGWAAGSVTIERGLVLPAEWHQGFLQGSASFARNNANVALTDGFYLAKFGDQLYSFSEKQGTQIDDTSVLTDGSLTHLLQAGRAETFWGQRLGTDDKPLPTTDSALRVHKVTFVKNGSAVGTAYRNSGAFGTFTPEQFGLDAADVLVFTDASGGVGTFTAATVVGSDLTVAVQGVGEVRAMIEAYLAVPGSVNAVSLAGAPGFAAALQALDANAAATLGDYTALLDDVKADLVALTEGYYRVYTTAATAAGDYLACGTSALVAVEGALAGSDPAAVFYITPSAANGASLSAQGLFVGETVPGANEVPCGDTPYYIYTDTSRAGTCALRAGNSGGADCIALLANGTVGAATSAQPAAAWHLVPAATLTLPLNVLGSRSYTTLHLPFPVTLDAAEVAARRLNFYTATVEADALVARRADECVIPAATAVLLVSDEAETSVEATIGGENDVDYPNDLQGTNTALDEVPAGTYVFGAVGGVAGFYPFAGTTLRANRAFVTLTSAVQRLAIVFDDTQTALGATSVLPETLRQQPVYDLQGRRVATPRKGGIYIVGGRRYVF